MVNYDHHTNRAVLEIGEDKKFVMALHFELQFLCCLYLFDQAYIATKKKYMIFFIYLFHITKRAREGSVHGCVVLVQYLTK